MNCKQGDLAVIVRSHDNRNVGKLVKVGGVYPRVGSSWWIFSGSILHGVYSDWPAGAEIGMYDSHLRPLRNEPGADETLSWKDVPQEVKA